MGNMTSIKSIRAPVNIGCLSPDEILVGAFSSGERAVAEANAQGTVADSVEMTPSLPPFVTPGTRSGVKCICEYCGLPGSFMQSHPGCEIVVCDTHVEMATRDIRREIAKTGTIGIPWMLSFSEEIKALNRVHFNVRRSSGAIENKWTLDVQGAICVTGGPGHEKVTIPLDNSSFTLGKSVDVEALLELGQHTNTKHALCEARDMIVRYLSNLRLLYPLPVVSV